MFIEITDCRLSNRKALINTSYITKLIPQRPTPSDPANCVVIMENDFISTRYEEVGGKDLSKRSN